MDSEQYWIEKLAMVEHPEGGFYKETFRSTDFVVNAAGKRKIAATAIYFLLTTDHFSAFHQIKSDETWYHHFGDALSVYVIHPDGNLEVMKIGNNIEKGEQLQGFVPAGCWFASVVEKENAFALVGCNVAPGFDFEDFTLAKREELIELYPQHHAIINRLTR